MGSSGSEADDATLTGSRGDGPGATDGIIATHRRMPVVGGVAIGRYLVLSKLGEGAMGVVHAAYDPELDRKVAIKLLKPVGAARNVARAKARLLSEAQALAKINHPNVVTVHDVGTTDEHVWLAMEFVGGRTLTQWRHDRQPGWKSLLTIMLDAGAGLAAVHAAGLVHRDFKPANLMVGDDGRVRVMDFGLAQQDVGLLPTNGAEPISRNLDRTFGGGGGTPAYMAPEQHAGEPMDARADQFAFCVVLWEALYGARPFDGSGMTDVFVAITEGRVARPSGNHRVPGWLHRTMVRGLAAKPEARWPSMTALLEVLARGQRRARSTRLAAAAGVLAISAWGVLGYANIEKQRARAECERAAHAAVEAFDERRDVVLNATSEDAKSRIEPLVVEFGEGWAAAAESTCIEATVDETVKPSLTGRGEACLEDQLAHLVAYLDLVATGELNATGREVDGAYGLPDPSRCRDERRLETTPWPSEAERPEVFRIRKMLAKSEAQLQAGRFAEAASQTEDAIADAVALGWPPLIAESRYRHAWALYRLSRLDEAGEVLADAFHVAVRSGDDGLAAAIATTLLDVFRTAHRFDEAWAWGEHAESSLARAGGSDDELHLALDSNRATLAMESGDYAHACDALRRALEQTRESRGSRRPDVASLLTHLGLCESYRGELDEAATILDEALGLRRELYGEQHPDVADSILNRAIVAYQRNDLETAAAGFGEAVTVALAWAGEETVFTARARLNLAATYALLERPDEAETELKTALPVLEATLGPEHGDVAAALNNLALLEEEAGKLDDALKRLEKAYAIRVASLGESHPATGRTAQHIGRVHRLRDDPQAALEWSQRAHAIIVAAVGPDHRDTALASVELARAHLGLGAGRTAEALLRDALRIRKNTDAAAGRVVGMRLALAEALQLQGQDAQARDEVDLAVRLAAEADDPELVAEVEAQIVKAGLHRKALP